MNGKNKIWDLVVIGGGAAGYFGAIACAEAAPHSSVLILEATARVLTKIKISGGGRCNVTHNQFDPKQLIHAYPRGQKELLGPFHTFQPENTVEWFKNHGVQLKAEPDGRMFPTTNNSQTIIDCLQSAAEKSGVELKTKMLVQNITKNTEGYLIEVKAEEAPILAKNILLATGSMPFGVALASQFGHKIVAPVPSLFTFEIENPLLKDMQGVSFPKARIKLKIPGFKKEFIQEGPALITHWGLSGPATLKLSALAARELYESKYQASIMLNWIAPRTKEDVLNHLKVEKKNRTNKKIFNLNTFGVVQRFWNAILYNSGLNENNLIGEVSDKALDKVATYLTQTQLQITGKGVFKEEFVTAGGVAREEIDFRTMQSKKCPGIYFAGEMIDIDGITGGFNFQNAWTGSWVAAQTIAQSLLKKNENC